MTETLIKKIRELIGIPRQLTDIRQSIDQQTEAIRTTDKRNEQQQNQLPVAVKVELEKDQEGKREAEADRQYRVQNSIRKATWLAFAAATIYAGIAYLQWRDAHQSFIVNNRAWVGIDRPIEIKSISSDITHGGKVSYVVTLKNFGNSVALSMALWTKAINGWDMMKPAMDDSCFHAAVLSRGKFVNGNKVPIDWPEHMSAGVLFPTETQGRHFTDDEIQVGKTQSGLMIIGCIVYRDQFGKERQTHMCFGSGAINTPTLIYQCPLGDNDAY
jgi:hypothetical protein